MCVCVVRGRAVEWECGSGIREGVGSSRSFGFGGWLIPWVDTAKAGWLRAGHRPLSHQHQSGKWGLAINSKGWADMPYVRDPILLGQVQA